MARFNYTAIGPGKGTQKGTVTAESAYAARKHLRSQGLHPVQIQPISSEPGRRRWQQMFGSSGKSQVGTFTKELSTMLSAGIKLTEALTVLITQVSNQHLKVAITDIRDRLVTGESFAETLTEYPQFFDVIYVSMMRVGEVTGTLEKSLATISTFMERRSRLEAKMTTAMIYPMILIAGSMGAVLFITIKVIPVIAEQI